MFMSVCVWVYLQIDMSHATTECLRSFSIFLCDIQSISSFNHSLTQPIHTSVRPSSEKTTETMNNVVSCLALDLFISFPFRGSVFYFELFFKSSSEEHSKQQQQQQLGESSFFAFNKHVFLESNVWRFYRVVVGVVVFCIFFFLLFNDIMYLLCMYVGKYITY